jgi:hypothetical protein
MTKSLEVITTINSNGGLDISQMRRNAKSDGVTLFEYIKQYVKNYYNVHGNVARVVANYFYN